MLVGVEVPMPRRYEIVEDVAVEFAVKYGIVSVPGEIVTPPSNEVEPLTDKLVAEMEAPEIDPPVRVAPEIVPLLNVEDSSVAFFSRSMRDAIARLAVDCEIPGALGYCVDVNLNISDESEFLSI